MKYAQTTNAIGAFFQERSRVFTRYNYETVDEKASEAMHDCIVFQKRATKFVGVDYKDTSTTTVTAHVKITQFTNETVVPTKEMLLESIGNRDKSFFQIDPQEYSHVSTAVYAAAVKQAGLGEGDHRRFVRLIRDIDDILRMHLDHGRTDILVGASELLGHECVMLFVQLPNMAMLIEISE